MASLGGCGSLVSSEVAVKAVGHGCSHPKAVLGLENPLARRCAQTVSEQVLALAWALQFLSRGCLSALTAWWPAGPGFESHSLSLLPHLLSTQTNSRMVGGDHTRV